MKKLKKKIPPCLFSLFLLLFLSLPLTGFAEDIKPPQYLHATLLPAEARVSERIFGLKGLSNVGRVSAAIYRGAQPQAEGYSVLRHMGIKTVINLRNNSEKKAVEAAGLKSIEVPLSVLKDVDFKTVDRILDLMADPENQPVFIHCRQGQDRTGIIVAAYRMKKEGWSLKDAEAEMQAFGFNDIWRELKEFLRNYAKSLGK